jgi:hypothetical protein
MQGMSIAVAPDEGQPFGWSQSRPDASGDSPAAGLALGDRRSGAIIAGPPGVGKSTILGKVIADLLARRSEGNHLFIIDPEGKLCSLWPTKARTSACEPADELVLPNSSFRIGGRNYLSLVGPDGAIYCEKPRQLLLRSTGHRPSPLRPLSAAEIEARNFRSPLGTVSTRVDIVDLLFPQRQGRVNRHRPRDLTALVRAWNRGLEALVRFLVNRLVVLLKRRLGVKRQRIALQPSALTHQHSVDQYRIRGPNFARMTSLSIFFGESVAA